MNRMYLTLILASQVLLASSHASPTTERNAQTERKTYEPEMISVPAGSLTMKCIWSFFERGCYNNAPPVRVVNIKPFQIGKFEVTFEQWDACNKDGHCHKIPDDFWGRGKHPVMDVSWLDAQKYLAWLNKKTGKKYRLPSDEEWEYAARAGVKTLFPWGDTASCKDADLYINNQSCHGRGTSVVGSFKPNNFGIHDIIGNLYEWTNSVDPRFVNNPPANGGLTHQTILRLVRGGSWFERPSRSNLSSQRYYQQGYRSSDIGFRVALSE